MEEEAPQSVRPSRDEVFDLAKGVGIIAVVVLHVSGRSAGLFHAPYSDGWWILKWVNLFVNFCVPLFLLVSAILLARSVSKEERPDWLRYARRRLRSILIPLVAWSIIYWLLRRFIEHDPHVMTPGYWTDVKGRLTDLVFGKAEFHLYFLSVLAQLCVVLPFVVILLRRIKLDVWVAVLFAIVMQLGAYFLHKAWPYDYPGSVILWYLSTVLPGIWIGMNWKEWPKVRSRSWAIWIFFTVGGFAALGYETWLFLLKESGHAAVFNLAPFAYGLGAPVLILALLTLWDPGMSIRWSRIKDRPEPGIGFQAVRGSGFQPEEQGQDGPGTHRLEGDATPMGNSGGDRLRVLVRRLGEMSLQIYLMHPILLEWLGKSWRLSALKALPLPSLWFFGIVLFGTYGISLIFERIGVLNPFLFGRDVPRPAPILGDSSERQTPNAKRPS